VKKEKAFNFLLFYSTNIVIDLKKIETWSKLKQFSSFYNNPKIIIGKSAVTENICSFIQRAALSNLPVLLVGETGVGKEVVAREIHRGSQRREGPFIPINSSCIPENLIESELYG